MNLTDRTEAVDVCSRDEVPSGAAHRWLAPTSDKLRTSKQRYRTNRTAGTDGKAERRDLRAISDATVDHEWHA
jgi:hypothetical protein